MAYIKTQGGQAVYPYSIGHLRKDNPNISFPKSIPDATLSEYGVYPVKILDAPSYDVATQILEQGSQPIDNNGLWELHWVVRDKTPEELAVEKAVVVAKRVAELKQFLFDTDYIAMPDYDKSKPDVIAQRQAWREEIRLLEGNA